MNEPSQRLRPVSNPSRGRRTPFLCLAGLAALLLPLAHTTRAAAQADVNPQMPNVMLLVDTSGSMEYKTSSNVFPICRYDANGLTPTAPLQSEKSRWTDLVEVLTGSITNYDCQTIDRGSAAFKNEYKIVGGTLANSPYDFLYSNPYHRPMSTGCVSGPGTLSLTNLADFPASAFNYHAYNNTTSPCTFSQSPDGILDSFLSGIRFGLMTFDTDPSPDQGELGTYSYVVGSSHVGKPTGCTAFSPMEVGSRNASAPPWEGRMVAFGDTSPGSLDYQTKNQQIQQILRGSRPYGATPIAGMLSDARDFLRNDTSMDLVNTSLPFGPVNDPYKSCRNTVLLLLSDGQPNMDLRGHCSGSDCPFQLPEDIAGDLLINGNPNPVKTYVIGFALNTLTVNSTPIDCSKLTIADLDSVAPALCAMHPDDPSLQACCNLARIAVRGDDSATRHAFFANDRDELRSDISAVLSTPLPSTSRTQVAYAPASSTGSTGVGGAFAASYRFSAQFTPVTFEPWKGKLTRERWQCDKDTHQASAVIPNSSQGDLFADNLNSQAGLARTFYTVQAAVSGTSVYSDRTIRPNLSSDPDGVGVYTGTFSAGDSAAAFVANTSPASLNVTDTTCTTYVGTVLTPLTAAQCRDRYMKWLVGLDNGTGNDRCDTNGCNLLGDIYHASPRVVNSPSELTRDETYQLFQNTYATRPMMLYTSTNDGMLHAFKVQSNDPKNDTELVQTKKNNELWAFIPPQVLPHIPSEYPYTHQLLLDGVSVIKDVVARKTSGSYPYVFERTTTDAASGASPNVTWRTILVQGFGSTYPGYFALDVTNPDPRQTINSETGGPKFLWQLTTDADGNPLFGLGGATPIITTLLFDEDGTGAREIPVAVLPGGTGGAGTDGPAHAGCTRATSTADLSKFSAWPPRGSVPCYTTNLGARSLTIVRLDTGKIIRTFRRVKTEMPAALQARVLETPLDSPVTGEPIAFPADVGAVADRIYIGDQDGTLWKVDVSNFSPDNWKMSLFWDTFPNKSINSKAAATFKDGQPIQTAPVLSVDTTGNVTVAVSTGDQTTLGAAPTMLNYLWSLTDTPDTTKSATVNWLQQFSNGERVTGPISLFSSYLYFSSVTPPSSNTPCAASGGANVWGEHYTIPLGGPGTPTSPAVLTSGGKAAPFLTNGNQFITAAAIIGGSTAATQATIFGVSVAQVPTCYDTDTVSDAYLGTRTQISNVNPGKFQLVFSTGSATPGLGGTSTSGTTGTASVELPTPDAPSRIDAWASIVE